MSESDTHILQKYTDFTLKKYKALLVKRDGKNVCIPINFPETVTIDTVEDLCDDLRNNILYDAGLGEKWTVQDAPAGKWRSVCYSPTVRKQDQSGVYRTGWFIAVSSDGQVMESWDGKTWTLGNIPAGAWESVCWSEAHNLFVAVASDGAQRVATSPDGTTWTGRTVPLESWKSICVVDPTKPHNNAVHNMFVVVGDDCAMTSTNGITWTVRSIPLGYWRSVCWTGKLFIAVASNGSYTTSTDGVNWVLHKFHVADVSLVSPGPPSPQPAPVVPSVLNVCASLQDELIFVTCDKCLLVSSDAINWGQHCQLGGGLTLSGVVERDGTPGRNLLVVLRGVAAGTVTFADTYYASASLENIISIKSGYRQGLLTANQDSIMPAGRWNSICYAEDKNLLVGVGGVAINDNSSNTAPPFAMTSRALLGGIEGIAPASVRSVNGQTGDVSLNASAVNAQAQSTVGMSGKLLTGGATAGTFGTERTIGGAVNNIPSIGTDLGTTDNNVVVTNTTGGLKPAGFASTDIARLSAAQIITGKKTFGTAGDAASIAPQLNLPNRTNAPTSPANGDVWTNLTSLAARINGTTRELYHAGNIPAYQGAISSLIGNDEASTVNYTTIGAVTVPIPVTVTAGTATDALPTSGSLMSLRAWLTIIRNNVAWLIARALPFAVPSASNNGDKVLGLNTAATALEWKTMSAGNNSMPKLPLPGDDDKILISAGDHVTRSEVTLSGTVDIVTSIGTPGSDDNIPTEKAVRDAIDAGGGGGGGGLIDYLLTEQSTGQLWLDRKPVRQMTVPFTASISSGMSAAVTDAAAVALAPLIERIISAELTSETESLTPHVRILNSGTTIDITGNPMRTWQAAASGQITFRYTKKADLPIECPPGFIPVTDITAEIEFNAWKQATIVPTIIPWNATNQAYSVSVIAGAVSISGNTVTVTDPLASGETNVTLRVTVANGIALGTNFTRDFSFRIWWCELPPPQDPSNYVFPTGYPFDAQPSAAGLQLHSATGECIGMSGALAVSSTNPTQNVTFVINGGDNNSNGPVFTRACSWRVPAAGQTYWQHNANTSTANVINFDHIMNGMSGVPNSTRRVRFVDQSTGQPANVHVTVANYYPVSKTYRLFVQETSETHDIQPDSMIEGGEITIGLS